MGAFGMEKCKLCGEWRFAYELNQMYECFYCLVASGELDEWPCPECEGTCRGHENPAVKNWDDYVDSHTR